MVIARGRTGFDSLVEAQAACRGWFVGLVKNRTKTNKRRSPRSRSRGLIDRDVWSWTPATAPNVDSRLIGRRSDRAGRLRKFVDARKSAVCRCNVGFSKISPDKHVDVCADSDEDRGSTPLASIFVSRAKMSGAGLA